jgi:hypothetical protein
MCTELTLAVEDEARAFIETVTRRFNRLKLIVIDTLSQTATGADENVAKDMSAYLKRVHALGVATGATVVVVHHSGKNPSLGERGSLAIRGNVDTSILVARKTEDGNTITVSHKKQKDEERPRPATFELLKVSFNLKDGSPSSSLVLREIADSESDFLDATAGLREWIVDRVLQSGGTLPQKELIDSWAASSGLKARTARDHLTRAIPEGKLAAWVTSGGDRLWKERRGNNPKGDLDVFAEGPPQ